uniref:Uncharacterized protein n=1 Tax=Oryza brachyantha TaxID=4533 RepID=A0A1V1H7T7_ORYBR|nr:hypothetical protein [Oryza brachyantha]
MISSEIAKKVSMKEGNQAPWIGKHSSELTRPGHRRAWWLCKDRRTSTISSPSWSIRCSRSRTLPRGRISSNTWSAYTPTPRARTDRFANTFPGASPSSPEPSADPIESVRASGRNLYRHVLRRRHRRAPARRLRLRVPRPLLKVRYV